VRFRGEDSDGHVDVVVPVVVGVIAGVVGVRAVTLALPLLFAPAPLTPRGLASLLLLLECVHPGWRAHRG
jgi:hypothetical protein